MSIFRVYFYDRATRREIDSPLNGKSWLGTSANVKRDGKYVDGTCTSVEIADFASLSRVRGARLVTAADFDRPVNVKIWYGDRVEWRQLLPVE